MAKREYRGEPIDMTDLPGESHITEREGETIAGSSADDLFEDTSNLLPDGLDEDDLSEDQKKAVLAFLTVDDKENVDFSELAEGQDFSKQSARRGVHKVFRGYRDMEDLFDSHKLAVLILAHKDGDYGSLYQLAEDYPLSRTVMGNAKRTYPDLIEEQKPVSKSELDEAIEAYLNAHPSKREENKSSSNNSGSNRTQKTKEDKEWPDDFSECQEWFIETITDNPSYKAGEIGDLMPTDNDGEPLWSSANYHNNVRQYPELIAGLIAEKGTASDVSDMADYLQKHIPVSAITEAGGLSASGNPEDDPNGGKQSSDNPNDDIEKRLRAVESKVESLRHDLENIETDGQGSEGNDLAQVVVESLSDEQLGRILRGAMRNE